MTGLLDDVTIVLRTERRARILSLAFRWLVSCSSSVNDNLVLSAWYKFKKCSEALVNSLVTVLAVYWVEKPWLLLSIFVYLLEHCWWSSFFIPAQRERSCECVCVCVSMKVAQPSVPISIVLSKQAQVNVPWQTHTASMSASAYHIYTIFILHNHSGQTRSLLA